MIDLAPFCSRTIPNLELPFSDGEWTYATDAAIIVRVPRHPDVTRSGPNAAKMFDRESFVGLLQVDIPVIPTFPQCPCWGCDGVGTVHDCPNCCHPCWECDGSGVMDQPISMMVDTAIVDARYVALMTTLPDLRIPPSILRPDMTISFSFDGGCGLLKPMRTRHPIHLDLILRCRNA